MTKFVRSFMFVLVLMSFVLAACGTSATEAPAVEPTSASVEPTAVAAEPTAAWATGGARRQRSAGTKPRPVLS